MYDLSSSNEHAHPGTILEELSRLRQRPVLFLCGTSMFSSQTTFFLYSLLRQLGPQEALDVVFQSTGGDPILARQLAILLRTYTRHLSILVLHEVRSAGTLFCLAADELVMNPLSALGPIDPQMPGSLPARGEQTAASGWEENRSVPRSIATEEVRLFREMALRWFGVGESIDERISLLHSFNQRIFPTTLTAFYRADQEMRQAADELLRYHQSDASIRQRICEKFISGYFSHAHLIHEEEARELGLLVRHTSQEEEDCLWRLLTWMQAYRSSVHIDPAEPERPFMIETVLITKEFAACDARPISLDSPPASGSARPATILHRSSSRKWGWRRIPFAALEISSEEPFPHAIQPSE